LDGNLTKSGVLTSTAVFSNLEMASNEQEEPVVFGNERRQVLQPAFRLSARQTRKEITFGDLNAT
jgi:hypothetical protein